MDMRSVLLRSFVCLFLMVAATAPAADAPREITEGEKALAVRFADLTQPLLRNGTPDENQFRRVAALLAAARRCDPDEPRYARLHADVLMQLHDADGAIEALGAVRRLRPEDRIAQIETIDMFLARMQTADARLAYLKDLVVREAVPREIRSHVALRIAALQEEKSRHNDALEAIDLSIKLNPLNFSALQIKFSMAWAAVKQDAAAANPVPRVAMLVSLVRANPGEPAVLHLLGRHLAAAGMAKDSLDWFTHAINAAQQSRAGLTLEMMIDFATASLLYDRLDQSQQAFDQILKFNPADYPSLIARSLIELRRDKPEDAQGFRVLARSSLINRLNTVRMQMGIPGATTRPIDMEIFMPEIGSDTNAYRKQTNPEIKAAYLQAVADLAWFQVFFNDQPDEAQRLMRHVELLMDPKEQAAATFLPRMAGWVYLKQGKLDEAKVKFSAVADREPMAALGLIKCYGPAEKDKARAEAQKLANANPAGVPGAVILDRLREFGIRAQPSENAPAMIAALAALPPNWMNILQSPAAFYAIRGQPLRISSPFGEPLIAQVVLQNISDVDLSVGADGLIKPGIWFDAQVGGIFQQNIPAVAYERISDAIILKPRQSVTLSVRVDQGDLLRLLQQRPTAAVGFKVIARTNPLFGGGAVVSGPGGYFIELAQPFERSSFPFNPENFQTLAKGVVSANGKERVRQLQLLAALAVQMGTEVDPLARTRVAEIQDVLRKARDQIDPALRAWAMYVYSLIAPEGERPSAVQRMFAPEESGYCRLLGMVAMEAAGLPAERQRSFAEQALTAKEDPKCVADFATATIKWITRPPQTQPSNPAK